MRPKILDLFCCAGGAAKGYHDAGFDVTGIDIMNQPRYPYKFIQADALEYVAAHGHEFDAIHASPPCQRYSVLTGARHRDKHPDLIKPVREALILSGKLLQIQLDMVAIEQVELMQVLLPLLSDGKQTFYAKLKENKFKQLTQ